MKADISLLRPAVQEMVSKAITIMNAEGIKFAITSTLRTMDEQQALYAQGRKPLDIVNQLRSVAKLPLIGPADNTYTVTNCDGVKYKSNHQGGSAIDIVPVNQFGDPIWPPASDPRWKQIADIMKAVGFQWGGDWDKFPDPPHYELKEV
jgi:peptidoglycan L-alanyl-D-glutamate endopeptidase CwlK